MKRIAVLLLILFLAASFTSCKKNELVNQWKPENLAVDGDDADWENVQLFMVENFEGAFATVNDTEDQYVILKLNDQRTANKIQLMGLTVWINSDGKKKKSYGVRYTGSDSLVKGFHPPLDFENQMEQFPRLKKMKEIKKAHLPEPGMLGIIQNGEVSMQPEKNPWGPAAASAEKEGVYCYEFKIPLLFDRSVTDEQPEKLPKKIKLCLEIGGLTDEMRKQMQEDMPAGGRGGMGGGMRGGGMRGGGMRGGGHGGGRTSGNQGQQTQEIWLDVVLAQHPVEK